MTDTAPRAEQADPRTIALDTLAAARRHVDAGSPNAAQTLVDIADRYITLAAPAKPNAADVDPDVFPGLPWRRTRDGIIVDCDGQEVVEVEGVDTTSLDDERMADAIVALVNATAGQ